MSIAVAFTEEEAVNSLMEHGATYPTAVSILVSARSHGRTTNTAAIAEWVDFRSDGFWIYYLESEQE